MNAFLDSLRADLLDRRLRPLLALLGVALVGGVAYAALGGSSAATPAATSSPATPGTAPGIALTPKPEGTQAIAETTDGASHQTGGATRNPFTPLPQANVKAASSPTSTATSASSTSAGGSSSSAAGNSGAGSGAGSGSGSGSTPTPEPAQPKPSTGGATSPSKPKTESKPATVYHVSALFGPAPAGTPFASAALQSYDKLVRQQALPSATQALVVFRGVVAGGKSAAFTLVGEAILRGPAACRPSPSQCQTIDLQAGQTEELEYAPLGAPATTYLLHIVAIVPVKATASAARRAYAKVSKAGLALLRDAGLDALPGLRYSGRKGVLVFTAAEALAARAHVASLRELSLLR